MQPSDLIDHREYRSFLRKSAHRTLQENDLDSALIHLQHLLRITTLNRDGDDAVFLTDAQHQMALVEERLGHITRARDLYAQAFHASVLRGFWRFQIIIVQDWARFEYRTGSRISGCRLYQLAIHLHIAFLDMDEQPKDEIGMEEELIDMYREFEQMSC